MTVRIEIERDYVKIEGQTVYRPERIVPGIWLSFWDSAVSPVDYQEAFDKGKAEGIREADVGYDKAYDDGYDEGFSDGEATR